ncbi:RNA recognition motif-containing protein [Desulfobaculum xiamenense]|uniref:RNA recognition motif-containing protein n=1 Tax=Desulfobaculum xiamenense TaxID=995050 RepID=A0A846QE14_9BACT|nr:RNA-binding protein [Desulfobaculum xiamenense]NJB66541.1 RNA recognition motif-containing protein [Desulfobaculum xiamenense]
MVKSIYVGNLPWSCSEDDLRKLFEAYGDVNSVKIVEDRETGRSRGFGFVEMEADAALKAIDNLTEATLGGRSLQINEARPRAPRPPRRW